MNDFKPKFIAWYEEDFQVDRIVQRMRPLQRYFYKQLLIESYYNPERPFLPNDDSKLCMLADAESIEQWQEHKAAILVKFTAFEDEQGRQLLKNKRVIEEWEKMVAQLEQRKNAGAASAKARATKRAKRNARLTAVALEVSAKLEKKESTKEKEENHTTPNQTLPHPTLPKSVQQSFNARSTTVQAEEKAAGRKDGNEGNAVDSTSKAKSTNSGQVKKEPLSGWRLEFQKQIQEGAADRDRSVVFQLPLPDSVFKFVESFGDNSKYAKSAILDWLDARSFVGLDDPNAVWDKMPNEIHGFLSAYGLTAEASHAY